MSERKKDCVYPDMEWANLMEATLPTLNEAKKSYQNIEVPQELKEKIQKLLQDKNHHL